jgi:biopolymer transport protein ExbB/TolQ
VFIANKMVRALIPWFNPPVRVCLIITTLSIQTHAQVGAIVTHCFGEPTEDINLWGMINKYPLVSITNLMLIAMAGYSLELIAERWLTLTIARKQSLNFQLRFGSALFRERFHDAVGLVAEYPRSPVALAVLAFMRSNPSALRQDSQTTNPSMHEWHRAIVIQSDEIRRRLWTLGAIGWSAPLLSVLYASVRISEAFQWWYAADGNSFAPFSNGASSAFWGVSFSVVIAVPSIWAYRYFCAQTETKFLEMQNLSLAIIEQLLNRQDTILTNASSNITRKLNVSPTRRIGC